MTMMAMHRILVGVDDSPDALMAFDYAIEEAKKENLELVIVSILESDEMNVYQALNKDFVHGEYTDLEKHVLNYRNQALQRGVQNVRVVIAEGEPGETIIDQVIPKVQPDLLIVGSKSQKGVAKYFGSQAAYMAKYAPIPVLVVR
ncbi:Universal stress family protein [Latilactobacillus fuchuensis]|jgi:nucleotide-binding universal stress UspA family protein|uniref:Universal stress family protein n=2 Tax=Latilactobacillus fuchuensis TaxID=164393 RepID=A0A2N9DY56_9LACO|nr:Universal stress family protein [Latilactobacillus fuchuensis]